MVSPARTQKTTRALFFIAQVLIVGKHFEFQPFRGITPMKKGLLQGGYPEPYGHTLAQLYLSFL